MKASVLTSAFLLTLLIASVSARPPKIHHVSHRKSGPSVRTSSIRPASLQEAALAGNVSDVEAALKRGAAIDQQDDDGDTALISATLLNNAGVVKTLLAHKASVNTENYHGNTALDYTDTGFPGLTSKEKQIKTLMASMLSDAGATGGDGNQSVVSVDRKLIGHVERFYDDPDDPHTHYIEGTVTNRSSVTLSYVEINANFQQGSDVVDSGLSNVQNLESGQSWHFKIISTGNNASSYSLTKLVGHIL